MKPCKNKDCISYRDDIDTHCIYRSFEGVTNCPIYNRLYKKKVPEKIHEYNTIGDNAPLYNAKKINEIIDYLQEAE